MCKKIISLMLCVVMLAGIAAIGANAKQVIGLSISGKAVSGGITFTITKSAVAKNYVIKHKGCYYRIKYSYTDINYSKPEEGLHKDSFNKSINTKTVSLSCPNNRVYCVVVYLMNKNNVSVYRSVSKRIDSYLNAPILKGINGTTKYIRGLYKYAPNYKYRVMVRKNNKWNKNNLQIIYYGRPDENYLINNGVFRHSSSNDYFVLDFYGKPGEKITYAMATYNEQNQLGPWTIKTVQVLSALTGKITDSKPASNTHKFTWNKANGATKYFVQITQANKGTVVYKCFTTKNSYAIKGLKKNVGFKISVIPYNTSGKGVGKTLSFKG